MATSSYTFPEVAPHGDIEKVLEDIYMVKGEIAMSMMGGWVKMAFSRNMYIIKQGNGDLVLIHTIRLREDALKELDKLGKVKHIIRLGAFHGKDDPFYKDRYGATVWAVKDTTYFDGFEHDKNKAYFTPDEWMTDDSKLPIEQAVLKVIESKAPCDGVLVLERPDGKVMFSGDSLQNYENVDSFFNWFGSTMMRMMGFIKPCSVGPAWKKVCKVEKREMQKLLELKFEHLLPCHGVPVLGKAWEKFEPSISSL